MNTERRNIMLGTAGHVDHGKSALVKLLTGCETDTLAEEKERGLTIDLGFAPCRLADQRVVGIVDVPGHSDFIRNMVAGAHGIDVVILVVAADDGIMPQTLEHLHILTLMGLRHGLVALTKTDLVDASRREFVTQDLRRLLARTFLDRAPICPISNITGEGFEAFFDALNGEVNACEDRPCQGPFRLWVEDAFSIRGAGTVVTGIPTHGRVAPGARLHLLPGDASGHVRRLQVYGEDATEGRAGECVALNIPELNPENLHRGLTLVESTAVDPVSMAECELRILDSVDGKIEDYLEVQLHVGTAAVPVHLAMLQKTEMTGGERQYVQLRLATPLPLVPGERFVIRANLAGAEIHGLTTIGGGRILGMSNGRLRRKKAWTLARLAARCEAVGDLARWCEQKVAESDEPVTEELIRKESWIRPDELAQVTARLRDEQRLVPTPQGWIAPQAIRQAAETLLLAVEKFHANNPRRAGVGFQEIRESLGHHAAVLQAAAESLVKESRLERTGEVLAKAGWKPQMPDRDAQACERLEDRFRKAGWAPPSLAEAAAGLGETPERATLLARLLAERGRLVRLDDQMWIHRDAVEAGKAEALKLLRRAPSFSTMDFRDALGVSRKYAVPLLDYLDRIRFTVRSGNNRTPGLEARKLLDPALTAKPA